MSSSFFLVNNIKLPINASVSEAFSVAKAKIRRLGLSPSHFEYSVFRRSVDARRRSEIFFVYSVSVCGEFSQVDSEKLRSAGYELLTEEKLDFIHGDTALTARPVVVGSGPAGLFAAYILAERGYRPLILERGGTVSERKASVKRLTENRILDPECNIQFGAGGAGTFSDGKLVTRINDPLCSYVLGKFCDFGADPSIKFMAKPHIGTDVLSLIIERMIEKITDLGGEIRYHTKFIRPISSSGKVKAVLTDKGEIECGALILAVGHSARDTYKELLSEEMDIVCKNFSVGMRIEHLRADIDKALYGDFAGSPQLGAAEYNLSYDTKRRGVYTFCMCPGGVVVPAASEQGGVVVNGMSYSDRAAVNSNSAVVCSIFKEDYGSTPESAIAFQRKIETAAFSSGGGDYSAPIITVGDFLRGTLKREPSRIMPSYMDGGVSLSSPEDYLPSFVTESIKGALSAFGKKIEGFDSPDAILTGAETRTSSPIRIIRDSDLGLATGYKNLYPSGEGAGYAGGITSAAVDGIRTAMRLIKEYKPFN